MYVDIANNEAYRYVPTAGKAVFSHKNTES